MSHQHHFPPAKTALTFIAAMLFAGCLGLWGQDYKIIKVNTARYPEIKATFLATDKKGEKVTNAVPADFIITENNANCRIIEVTNPNQVAVPVSIVLVFDVSISMSGYRLNIAKKVAKTFIEQIPLESSEVAIASFSDDVYMNCDFTQDPERLFSSLETMRPVGGTNYTSAFLNNAIGALAVAADGKYRRCIIFLTDGLSNTDGPEIIKKAKEGGVTVFNISVELPTPDVLREISDQTGGKYYQTVAVSSQLESIYASIFQTLEIAKYGTVTWKALEDCKKARSVRMLFRNKPQALNYDIPNDKAGGLEIDPSLLAFGTAPPGISKNLSVDLTARNIPLNITNISIPGKSPFYLADSIRYPLVIKPNLLKNITLAYKPQDANMVSTKLVISSRECPDKSITMLGGSDEQLRLICPKGGETLVVGTDTSVQWEGVKKEKNVAISFRANPGKPWIPVADGSGLYYPWVVPKDTTKQAQVKLKPITDPNGELFLSASVPNQRSGLRSVYFSNNGSKMMTTDKAGIIKIWDSESGRPLATIDGFRSSAANFGASDNCVVSFSRDEILTWDTDASRLINRQTTNNSIIFTSLILADGSERLISGNVLRDKANNYKIWMPEINKAAFIFEKSGVRTASLSMDGQKAISMDDQRVLKLWDTRNGKFNISNFQPINPISIIINPNGKTALISDPGSLIMIDMNKGNDLFRLRHETYQKFSNSGDMVITKGLDNSFAFNDSYTGKCLVVLGNIRLCRTFGMGYGILFYRNDSIILMDAQHKKPICKIHKPLVLDLVISPDDKKIMAVLQSNVIEFYNAEKGTRVYRISDIDNNIRTALFSPNGKSIAVVMSDHSIQYWSPQGKSQNKEVVSGYFSIISPKPYVKKRITFNDRFLKSPEELVVPDFITNPTRYSIAISGIEIVSGDTADFGMVANPAPARLEPLGKIAGEFRFSPSLLGKRNARIRTCTPTDTFFTEVTGNGIIKPFEASTANLDFGKLKIFQHKDSTITILKNTSTAVLTITDIENAGPDKNQFSTIGLKQTYTLKANDSIRATIRFSPTTRGKTSGSLKITLQGIEGQQTVTLHGEGIASRTIWLYGKTRNATDSMPIAARVKCTDLLSNNLISNTITNNNGSFGFKINADRNYGLIAEKKGYLSTSENVDVREATLTDTIRRDIYLTELKSGASIRMNCIFFEFAKANLLTTSKNELNRVVELLTLHKTMAIELQGHTDSIGSDQSNIALSNLRTNAVRDYLIKQGIAAPRLTAKGFGETRPVSTNATAEGRQLNRRVELKIIKL